MREEVTPALVLARYPHGEADLRVTLFTRELGKLHATAISGRKLTSKLSPHLVEGSVAAVRIVESRGIRVVDALTTKRDVRTLEECLLLDRIVPEHVQEEQLWDVAVRPTLDWRAALALSGWGPAHASCARCASPPTAFVIRSQEFLCASHAPDSPPGELVLLSAHA